MNIKLNDTWLFEIEIQLIVGGCWFSFLELVKLDGVIRDSHETRK